MAAAPEGKAFKQDLVVSIRYRNDLPPPPMPPKLLDIEHEGISQYLTTGFASGLARREQPNIDVDAEGGMPIDMIGIPGYFLGDESSIMAPTVQPVLDPADANLLLTPDQLKIESTANQGHAFLRKTQYMNAANAKASGDAFFNSAPKAKKLAEKSTVPLARENPDNIKRNIQKGFDLAYPDSIPFNEGKGDQVTAQERHAWKAPTHPTNPSLKPVGFFPLLPDLDATTDGGFNWDYVKFSKPPFPAHHDRRDERIDAGLLYATENKKEMPSWQARKDAFDRDPQNYDDPGPEPHIWSLHVPRDHAAVSKVRRILNDGDSNKDNADWLAQLSAPDGNDEMRIPFPRARVYHSVKREFFDSRRFMALSLFDPAKGDPSSRLQKQGTAAYYYPIWARDTFKAERAKVAGTSRPAGRSDDDDDDLAELADELMILPFNETEIPTGVRYLRAQSLGKYDKHFAEKWQALELEALAEQEKEKADQIIEEQGTLQPGAADVSMAEIEAAEDAEMAGNEGGRDDREEDNDDRRSQNGGRDEDSMDDD